MPSEPSLALLAEHDNAEYSSRSSSDLQGLRFLLDYDDTSGSIIDSIRNSWHQTPKLTNKNVLQTRTTPEISTPKRNIAKVLVVTLHAFLVAIHGALLAVLLMKLESRIAMPLTEGSGLVSTLILVVSQIFVITFTAVLLFFTQRVANQKLLTTKLLLTADHDTATAWTGLGAALLTLTRQHAIPAAVTSITAIAAYLVGLVVLYTTTSSLFSLQLLNETSERIIPTQKYSNIDIDMSKVQNKTLFKSSGVHCHTKSTMLAWMFKQERLSHLGVL